MKKNLVSQLYIFRHGETEWNATRRFQGHSDIPLNEKGRDQARILETVFRNCRPDIILSSDLDRAHETARIANQNVSVPIELYEELRECRLGDSEGLSLEKVKETFGIESWEYWKSSDEKHLDFGFPNGETKRDHLHRIFGFLEKFIIENSHFTKIGISTHGGCIHRVLQRCRAVPSEITMIPNCALFLVEFDHAERSWLFVDTLHAVTD
jgi:broad specificity phosphatase PhoE